MKAKQVKEAIKVLSKCITPCPGKIGFAAAVLIIHIQELEKVNTEVLKWWKEHEHDTVGHQGGYNLFDCIPDFVCSADMVDNTPSTYIHYWCEGTWCLDKNLHEYTYMSDDYTTIKLPDSSTYEEIEDIVQQRLSIGKYKVTIAQEG